VVRDGVPLAIDLDAALDTVAEAQAEALARVPERDWAGRAAEEMSPLVYPVGEV